ncbi:putative integral membrane protein [Theileria parva strain Muguga]|uniref:putative integral membrane protein n=1 Tax=Theileria parva strain Muguga TaxID=333668 RepID=UPI001C61BB3A|nr:putative integral membrane protein [Theileria parva strain Muguga]EAN30519.2 putative integral membrane protein [Theileria parva strain Muguga]
MDSIRTKKSSKKAWIVGTTLVLGVLIVGVIVCLAISGVFDSDKDEKEVKIDVPVITTLPQAFEFIDEVYKKNFPGEDGAVAEELKTLESIKNQMISRLDAKKQAEDEEKKLKEQQQKEQELIEAEIKKTEDGDPKKEPSAVASPEGNTNLTVNKDATVTPGTGHGDGKGTEDAGKVGGAGGKDIPDPKIVSDSSKGNPRTDDNK